MKMMQGLRYMLCLFGPFFVDNGLAYKALSQLILNSRKKFTERYFACLRRVFKVKTRLLFALRGMSQMALLVSFLAAG